VRTFTVAGSERLVIYDDMAPGETIKVYDKTVKAGPRDGSSAPYSVEYGHGPVTIPYIAESEPLKDEAAHFLRCIRTAERPLSDAWAALKVVRILETVERSVYNGGSLEPHQSTDGARVKDGAASVAAARGKAKP
jgi:predicted dehydrogenase